MKEDVPALCSCWQPPVNTPSEPRQLASQGPRNRAPAADFPCGAVVTPARDRPWDLSQEGVCKGGGAGRSPLLPIAGVPGAPENVAAIVQGAWPQGAVGEPLTPQGSPATSKVLPKATSTLAEPPVMSQHDS